MKSHRPIVLTGAILIVGVLVARQFVLDPIPEPVVHQTSSPIAVVGETGPGSVRPAPAISTSHERASIPTSTAPAASSERTTPVESQTPAPSAGLIVEGKLVPGRAMQLLDSGFDALLAELRQQAQTNATAAEMRELYVDQIAELLAGTEVTLRRMECGSSVCAAELFRSHGADPTDPFSGRPDRLDDRLPRDARVELALMDSDRNALRRFVFSIDPEVNSLYVPRRDK